MSIIETNNINFFYDTIALDNVGDLLIGDCREVLSMFPDACVDSIVTDPPYGLSFMGKKWDYDVPGVDVWRECLRVLKPGGHLLAFFGTRTYHRGVVQIEDAGFDVRDQIGWAYGSGFPKSHNGPWGGTALKPAWEPICMAQKPRVGTVEANWLAYSTGALNIDSCRVETNESLNGGAYAKQGGRSESQSLHGGSGMNQPGKTVGVEFVQPAGRWPANLIHDGSDEVLVAFPQAPGQMADVSTSAPSPKTSNVYGKMMREGEASADSNNEGGVGFKMKPGARRLDTGSAARFFYCAKASKSDRGEGNRHPTVKPTELMRYLCRLVTPAGGLVLDPFMGSGSTGKAASLEGLKFIGIEREGEYAQIARQRLQPDFAEFF
jgi:DNA modification methylase